MLYGLLMISMSLLSDIVRRDEGEGIPKGTIIFCGDSEEQGISCYMFKNRKVYWFAPWLQA